MWLINKQWSKVKLKKIIGNAARQASRYLLCSLASFRGSAVESGIWVRARVCGKHFLGRNAAIGQEAERL